MARVEAQAQVSAAHGSRDYMVGIVIGYVASVITSIALMLTFLRHGW